MWFDGRWGRFEGVEEGGRRGLYRRRASSSSASTASPHDSYDMKLTIQRKTLRLDREQLKASVLSSGGVQLTGYGKRRSLQNNHINTTVSQLDNDEYRLNKRLKSVGVSVLRCCGCHCSLGVDRMFVDIPPFHKLTAT